MNSSFRLAWFDHLVETAGQWGGRRVEVRARQSSLREQCRRGLLSLRGGLDTRLIWMQLIRKVDWFDGTSGAGQQSALVCEGVHARVDIYAFRGSFNNSIRGSASERRLLFVLDLSHSHVITNPFQTYSCLLHINAGAGRAPKMCLRCSGGCCFPSSWWVDWIACLRRPFVQQGYEASSNGNV